MKYTLVLTSKFDRSFRKLSLRNKIIENKITSSLEMLADDPFNKSLRTHRVISRNFGEAYSSRVTGDLRLIWNFSGDKLVILVLNVGGHSGGNSVY